MNDAEAKALRMLAKAAGLSWQTRMMNGATGFTLREIYTNAVGGRVEYLWQEETGFDCVEDGWLSPSDNDWPDFRDPPTMGWLLHQVREAWGDLVIWLVREEDGGWSWDSSGGIPDNLAFLSIYDTEAGALIAALEHAPKGGR